MYENTNSSIDWKGIILKVIIAFLVVAIAFTGVKTFTKSNSEKKQTTTNVVESNSSATFTANIEKLKEAGEKYYKTNTSKLPKEGISSMVTLNELVNSGFINSLSDADGKVCDGESSYVTAVKTGDKYTIKANLVCGESYSYVTAYLGENDVKVESTTETNKGTSIVTNTQVSSTKTSNTKTTNSCGTSCTPVVSTEVKQNVTINTDKNTASNNTSSTISNNTYVPKRTYIVSYDRNGGSCYSNTKSMYVNEGEYANNPGNCNKSGYNFVGWYLDGREYDFNTPVTRDIKLVATYEDDYNNNSNYDRTATKQVEQTVYSMGWADSNINTLTVNHTLSIERALELLEDEYDISRRDVTKVRIYDIYYRDAIDTESKSNTFRNLHESTFIYSDAARKYQSKTDAYTSLAYIDYAKVTASNSKFVNISKAERNGFDVTWVTNSIDRTCKKPFSMTLPSGNYVDNLCNFGIRYTVIWEFVYEY